LIFRKGAKEFLQFMQKNDIPVVIISAGIGDTIKFFLKNNKYNKYFELFFIIISQI
jgi:2-hydroxy-3-keto-5-methylthiopentenyl-1-phosphate phosphatase